MAKHHTPTPDGVTLCVLCHTRQETFSHLFFECPTTYPIWEYIYHLTQRITGLRLNPCFELSVQFNFPNHASHYSDILILLYTVTRHTISKIRNTARFGNKTVDSDKIIQRIKQTLRHRYSCETRKTKPIYESTLCRICAALWWKKLLPKYESPTQSETPARLSCEIPTFSIERAYLQFSATRSSAM